MSYLTLANGVPNFSKAVISLWFRAPRASVIAAANNSLQTQVEGFLMMQSVLPLITFGQAQMNRNYQAYTHDVASYHFTSDDPLPPYNATGYSEGLAYDVEPSCIGLLCSGDGTFGMFFNIQMGDSMSLSGTNWITTRMDIFQPATPPDLSPGSGWVTLGVGVYGTAAKEEASYIHNDQPEFFRIETDSSQFEADKWHHLLLSFDVGGSVSIGHPHASSTCKLWYAVDDMDYRGADNLGPYRDADDGLDDNVILTKNAWTESGVDLEDPRSYYFENQPIPLPSGSYSGGSIPALSAAMGIPSSAKYVDSIFRVEMAEFQMWTDVTMDTSIESNRRAFVDADGNPVDPTEGTEDDPRAPAEKLLGKKPEILLHGDTEWQAGHNTGTLGVIETSTDGTTIDILNGQFVPTARIEEFDPEPTLSETETA